MYLRVSLSTVICVLPVSIRASQLEELNLVSVLGNSKLLRTDHARRTLLYEGISSGRFNGSVHVLIVEILLEIRTHLDRSYMSDVKNRKMVKYDFTGWQYSEFMDGFRILEI